MAPTTTSIRAFGSLALTDANGVELGSVLAHRKHTALLLYLALAKPAGMHRRDTLLALFWPELSEDRARAALNKAAYHLRRAIGEDALLRPRDDALGLDLNRIRCDVHDFEAAVANDDHERAVSLHGSELLAGFHLNGARAFMEWLDNRRRTLRRLAGDSALEAARHASESDEVLRALRAARQARTIDPFDERAVRATMLLEDRLGARANAIRTYDEFAAYVRRELDADPSPETLATLELIRSRRALTHTRPQL